jgi:putative zinc finger/helix-turn-helix YgiT family protein
MTATHAAWQEEHQSWKVEGEDTDGDPLTIAVVIEADLIVVTVFWKRRDMKPCPICNSSRKPQAKKAKYAFGDVSVEVEERGLYCRSCDQLTLARGAMEESEKRIARALIDAGITSGPAFRHIRKAAGFQAKEVAELLGTTPETVSRWENGQRDIPRPVMALTAAIALERMSGERDELRARLERYGQTPAKRLSA